MSMQRYQAILYEFWRLVCAKVKEMSTEYKNIGDNLDLRVSRVKMYLDLEK